MKQSCRSYSFSINEWSEDMAVDNINYKAGGYYIWRCI